MVTAGRVSFQLLKSKSTQLLQPYALADAPRLKLRQV